jgi:MFS family permease
VPSRFQPLAKLGRNPSLRRAGIGFALFNSAEYGEWIAVLVYAYAHGGASASGLLAFAQLLPCVVLAPLMATFADRYQPGRVLVAGYAAQAVGMGLLAAALLAHAPPFAVYALAILAAPTFNVTRPTVNVVLPLAVRTPDELTAGNAAMGWIENAGVVAGPLAASLLVALGGPGAVVGLFAILMLLAAWAAVPLTRSLPAGDAPGPGSPLSDAGEAFRLLARERGTAMLVGVLTSQALFIGALDVLYVVLAIDELGLGDSGVGILNAAFGAGGLVAVFVTLGLVGRRRLAPSLIGAALLMGAAVALIAAWPHVALALVLLAAANVGRSLFDVSGRTLLQRTGSPAVLGRIFGVLESIDMLGLALGSLLVSLLVALGGTSAAVLGVGAIMPLVVLVLLPAILGADARATVPIVQIGLLRKMPLFRPLPPPELEGVARAMEPLAASAGDVLIREGEPGDVFYVLADGEVAVSTAAGFRTTLVHGEGFGEIALLNDTARTATVTAVTDASLYCLSREDFLAAVTGMADVHHAARRLAADRLAQQEAALTEPRERQVNP